jgi:raffinose/stachyose/melibiose transport system substrate-binding protein
MALICGINVLYGCTPGKPVNSEPADSVAARPSESAVSAAPVSHTPVGNPVTLNTFSSFAGNDGNALKYQTYTAQWQEKTGNKLNDTSAVIEETVKARIRTDFSAGAEPDVLFYFTGVDANEFLDKVMTIEEIRKEFPDYAANMKESAVPVSAAGVWYAVPVNGFWENLFVNKKVLQMAGVAIPGIGYTWDRFLTDCQKIKDAGLTPIAASFVDVPHYWWEFTIFNNTSPRTHLNIPGDISDDAGKAWIAGMKDIKEIYDRGFFPENALSEKDDAMQELFYNDKAAFMLDGSWRVNALKVRSSDAYNEVDPDKIKNFSVASFPSKGFGRKSTDMIGGMSMGWYITKKCWNDPDKKAAAVDFITFVTSDAVVSDFTGTGASALKNGVILDPGELDALDNDVIKVNTNATTFTAPVQDLIAGDVRNAMFQNIPQTLIGKMTAEDLIGQFVASYNQ